MSTDDKADAEQPFLLTLADRSTDEVKAHWPDLKLPPDKDRDGLLWAWRSVKPDLTSSHGYRWPFPGHWARSPGPFTKDGPCPTSEGDGICLAHTTAAAASGGLVLGAALVCAYLSADVLGAGDGKTRVKRAWVAEVVASIPEIAVPHANLTYADLTCANLRSARYSQATLFPAGFDAKAAGAEVEIG